MYLRKIILAGALFAAIAACNKGGDSTAASPSTGTGGSIARFTIVGTHLYIADESQIFIYDIANPANAHFQTSVPLSFGVETIFPYKDKIFVGSNTGMHIYTIDRNGLLKLEGSATHVRSCDPVVANDTVSFVTLRTGACGVVVDGLYMYDTKKIDQPSQIGFMGLSTPYGLGLKDSILYVCQQSNGLSLINVKDATSPVLIKTVEGETYNDVIPYGDLLICYVSTGLLMYDISDPVNIKRLSSVNYNG